MYICVNNDEVDIRMFIFFNNSYLLKYIIFIKFFICILILNGFNCSFLVLKNNKCLFRIIIYL